MRSDAMPYGYRILGPCDRERKLVRYDDAFAAYAACDDRANISQEAFLSAFQYDEAIRDRIVDTTSLKLDTVNYGGPCWSRFVWFDIDADGDVESATMSARRLCTTLLNRYRVDEDSVLVFFSGSKGYHVGLPTSLFSPKAETSYHTCIRNFAEGRATEAGVKIDTAVYAKVQPLRAPNSRHGKSGRYKRVLTFDELMHVRTAAIVERAADPLPFELPNVPAPDERAIQDWAEANQQASRQAESAVVRSINRTSLNRTTMDFIRDGAIQGERQTRLFSAAANLAEFGCTNELAHALLTESARDSGLTPLEVRRAINNGLNHKQTQETEL